MADGVFVVSQTDFLVAADGTQVSPRASERPSDSFDHRVAVRPKAPGGGARLEVGDVTDGRQALGRHQLHDGPSLAKAQELLEDEQLLLGRRRQPSFQRLPAGVLGGKNIKAPRQTRGILKETLKHTERNSTTAHWSRRVQLLPFYWL